MYTHTCTHIHAHTYMHTHTCTHIHAHTHMHTHTCTHTHAHTHTCTHTSGLPTEFFKKFQNNSRTFSHFSRTHGQIIGQN